MNGRVFDFAFELNEPYRSKTFSLLVLRAEDAKTKTFSASCIGSVHSNELLCEITRENQIVCLINIPTQAWPVKGIPAISQQVVWFWSERPHTTSSAEKWQINMREIAQILSYLRVNIERLIRCAQEANRRKQRNVRGSTYTQKNISAPHLFVAVVI